jgi:hypothetical protein
MSRGDTTYDGMGDLNGSVYASDTDGYIRSVTVTWPDGSLRTYRNPTDCVDPSNAWPNTAFGFRWNRRLQPGVYSIKATALSTDCEGRNVQTTTLIVPFRLFPDGKWKWWGKATRIPQYSPGPAILGEPTVPEQPILNPASFPPEP